MAVASEQADRHPLALAGDSPAALEGQGMTKPRRYLTRMGVFLLVAALACGLLFPALRDAFMANPVLNGVILGALLIGIVHIRSEEHTSELQSLMRISYAVFCLKKKKKRLHKLNDISKTITNKSIQLITIYRH